MFGTLQEGAATEHFRISQCHVCGQLDRAFKDSCFRCHCRFHMDNCGASVADRPGHTSYYCQPCYTTVASKPYTRISGRHLAAAGAAATEHSEESARMEGTEANTPGRLHIESGKPMNMFQAPHWASAVVQFRCDDCTPNWDRPRRIGMRELNNYLANREELEYTNEVQKTLSTTEQLHGNCNQSCAATEHAAIAVLPASTTATAFNLSAHLRHSLPTGAVAAHR